MRGSSSRAATAAALAAGLAVLVVAGRLLSTTPRAPRPVGPATAAATTRAVPTIPSGEVPASTVRGVQVPNAIGRTLAQATSVLRAAGLQGAAFARDPQISTAVVVAQEPPAGVLSPPGSVVGLRTRTDVQANGSPRRLRLGRGPTSWGYQLVAPDPARHQLTVVVTAPRGIEVQVWLQTGSGRRLQVFATTRDASSCHPAGRRSRCVVRFGALDGESPGLENPGPWTATIAKQSSAPAVIQVTVTFTPL
jgi:PASTA domain